MQKYMWDQFKREYGKSYVTENEETTRFSHFLSNLQLAEKRNEMENLNNGTAIHGITKFFDLSEEEFAARYLRSDVSMRTGNAKIAATLASPKSDLGLVDWTGVFTTPVKDQGYCGSCWAFSATEQIETDLLRAKGTSQLLSVEQIVQCDSTSYGCSGGWTENAYNYVKKAGGIETEAAYPYSSYNGATGRCQASASQFVASISGYTTVRGEDQMASYVQSTGPLSVCVDASSWSSYRGGVMSACGKQVNHCVQAVGVDASSYWKVRNSWGTSWGESGHIRLAFGQNTCAITNDPTYVTF
jgi:C1A family cysteine protease